MFQEWVFWHGKGLPPLKAGQMVRIQRANQTHVDASAAVPVEAQSVTWRWSEGGMGDDVIAYSAEVLPVVHRLFGNAMAENPVFQPDRTPGATHVVEYRVTGNEIAAFRMREIPE